MPFGQPDEYVLQLSKQAINTDSSQMLYPDFTVNLGHNQPMGKVFQNPQYFEIAEFRSKGKKIKNFPDYPKVFAPNLTD